jgi:acyl-CoA dehydrogenase
MRLLVPIAKYRTARDAVDMSSYACEVLGGNGYVNGFATEQLLRDTQVLPIWEGTSNILSLDVLRVMAKLNAHEDLIEFVSERLEAIEHPHLADLASTVESEFETLQSALLTLATEEEDYAQHEAKELADYIYEVVTATLLLSEAQTEIDEDDDARKALVAQQFVETYLETDEARGITNGEKLPDDHYDEVVRFAPLAPETLVDAAPADD